MLKMKWQPSAVGYALSFSLMAFDGNIPGAGGIKGAGAMAPAGGTTPASGTTPDGKTMGAGISLL